MFLCVCVCACMPVRFCRVCELIASLAGFASVAYVCIRRRSTSVSVVRYFFPLCGGDRGKQRIRKGGMEGWREGVDCSLQIQSRYPRPQVSCEIDTRFDDRVTLGIAPV